jgi:glycosyltransferase involved in cell wall biosynthesis
VARPRVLFCGLVFPRYPGHSGGEIRDFHLLQEILKHADVEAICLHHTRPAGQHDPLAARMLRADDPATLVCSRPDLFPGGAPKTSRMEHLRNRLVRLGMPPLGRYHWDAATHLSNAHRYVRRALLEALEREPDVFVVSPQLNPAGLILPRVGTHTRWVLATYDVETVRMERLARAARGVERWRLRLEARRARLFEADNLARYDGVVAVSKHDRDIFGARYSLDPTRVLAIDNGVDPEYFGFRRRTRSCEPELVYVGSLTYAPNRQAAAFLLDRVMPRVWAHEPKTRVSIVGQGPDSQLSGRDDGPRVQVTGRVPDVRPYLERATLGCFPLLAGSGTKYKVLESLAAGVPLVCSPIAAEGLDLEHGHHLLVAQGEAETADAILDLLRDPARAQTMADAGRERVEVRYSWKAILPPLVPWLTGLGSRTGS